MRKKNNIHYKTKLPVGIQAVELSKEGNSRIVKWGFRARLKHKNLEKVWTGVTRSTLREAQVDYDRKRIELGEDPLYVLKPLKK